MNLESNFIHPRRLSDIASIDTDSSSNDNKSRDYFIKEMYNNSLNNKKDIKYKLNYKIQSHKSTKEKDRCYSRFFLHQESLPTLVDLRPFWGEIFEQGDLGSCTANSISGNARFALSKVEPNICLHPSRLFIYYNARLISGEDIDEDDGLSIRDGCLALKKYGACNETIWPYNFIKFAKKPPTECYEDAKKYKYFAYFSIANNLNQIKQCLSQKNVVTFGAKLFDSFMSEHTRTTGIVAMPKEHEGSIGGHSMCIVGYNDETKMFAVANSWSEEWGNNGFCFMPYDYISNTEYCGDFYFLKYYSAF